MNKQLQAHQEGKVFSPQEVMKAEFIPQNITRGVCHKLTSMNCSCSCGPGRFIFKKEIFLLQEHSRRKTSSSVAVLKIKLDGT